MHDRDLVPISALQHYLYCPRQCGLIHIERLWSESRHTAEGRLLHTAADRAQVTTRHGVRSVAAMPLSDSQLGIIGKADIVEFQDTADGLEIVPVEFKRGRPKRHRADEVQLCAQAFCLETMLGVPVHAGALFYGKVRRRKVVVFDAGLRALTKQTIATLRDMIRATRTPSAEYESRRCDACSLIDLCQPRWLAKGHNIIAWLTSALEE